MTLQDFFFLSLGIGVWIIIFLIVLVVFQLVWTLTKIRRGLDTAKKVGLEVAALKEGAKINALSLVIQILRGLARR